MKPISSSIVIAAPQERVWDILTDFAAYPEWNPFMPAISGPIESGGKLSVRIHPPGGKAMAFTPTVLVAETNQELRCKGRLVLPAFWTVNTNSNYPRHTKARYPSKVRFSAASS